MSFVASQSTENPANTDITNDVFYPDISTADFRKTMNVGNDIDEDHVVNRLSIALFKVNHILEVWRSSIIEYAKLEDIPAPSAGAISEKVFFYKQAVYAYARAQLIESRRDLSTTAKGHDKADNLDETMDDYYRQSHEAIRMILNKPRTTVELI
jgi:hypothetical protein